MTFRQLEYFLSVCKTMNFTRASENLHVSQTTVTKQVHLLEKELNTELFDRSQKKIVLTESGRFFQVEAEKLMYRFQLTEENMVSFLRGEKGTLKVGFLKNMDPHMLISIITEFRALHPQIVLDLRCAANAELYDRLANNSLDCIMAQPPSKTDTYNFVILKQYPLVAVIPADYPTMASDKISLAELDRVIYDVRDENRSTGTPDIEEVLLKIASYGGCAIAHSFIENNIYSQYVKILPLTPYCAKQICLVYDEANNYHLILERFIKFMIQKKIYMEW